METLREWLKEGENRRGIHILELELVLDTLNNNAIGIQGSGIFSISWSIICTVSQN